MAPTQPAPDEHRDAEAIAAIRSGETERFRELVERYERRVYAVAWSRLGDASLAEDAVQESFLRAYRWLGWLRDPARFAGWVTRIARGVSVNLGIRHRRELRRRERWALDPAVSNSEAAIEPAEGDPGAAEPEAVAERIRSALESLPSRHRECLVLHYLEGRSGAAAAAVLGISEGTFKVRLHRARRALRGVIEKRIEDSLREVGPRRTLVPGIMSAVLVKAAADPTGTMPGIAAALGVGVLKLVPMPLFFLCLPVLVFGVGFKLHTWAANAEGRNFADPEGFRRRLFEDQRRRARGDKSLVALLFVFAVTVLMLAPKTMVMALSVMVAPMMVLAVSTAVREAWITGSFTPTVRVALTLPIFAVGLLSPWFVMPPWFLWMGFAGQYLGMVLLPSSRASRFDYNLFLRARLGLLPDTGVRGGKQDVPASSSDVWRFIRFAAREGWFVGFRTRQDRVSLRLHPVSLRWTDGFGLVSWRSASRVCFRPDGSVDAVLGSGDVGELDRLGIPAPDGIGSEERAVKSAVISARNAFLAGREDEAKRLMGHQPDAEVFVSNPAKLGFARLHKRFGSFGLAFTVVVLTLFWFVDRHPGLFESASARRVPVPWTIEEARQRWQSMESAGATNAEVLRDLVAMALIDSYVLPPYDWLGPAARDLIWTNGIGFGDGSNEDRVAPPPGSILAQSWPLLKAMRFGWGERERWAAFRENTARQRELVLAMRPEQRVKWLQPDEFPVLNQAWRQTRFESVRWRLAALRELGLLDLFETKPLVERLKACQVLSGRPLPEWANPDLDRRVWDGLFVTRGSDPIADTYEALSVLEELGWVGAVDRAACEAGLRRFHAGEGRFVVRPTTTLSFARRPPDGTAEVRPFIQGDARTTFAAYQSLRMLPAIGVIDPDRNWRMTIVAGTESPDSVASRHAPGVWYYIESALLKEAFEKSEASRWR